MKKLIINAFGPDRPGIVAEISEIILSCNYFFIKFIKFILKVSFSLFTKLYK